MTTNYTLDLAAGLTQVLDDGVNTYVHGNGRIAQADTTTEYFLGDALGSVRQLADSAGVVTLTQSYSPYGETVSSVGSGYSAYQYTGEIRDTNGLTYLRARYLEDSTGRFISRDTWDGVYERPLSLNRWNYVEANPVNLLDPNGHEPSGYAEGFVGSVTAALAVWKIHGKEIVYDFETLERAEFTVTGSVDLIQNKEKLIHGYCTSVISLSIVPYFTHIEGFDSKGLEAQWSGDAIPFQVGIDIPTPILWGTVGLPVGIVPFSTAFPNAGIPNFDVGGFDIYYGFGIGTGVWDTPANIALFRTYTVMDGGSRKQYRSIDHMAEDIKNGYMSRGWTPQFVREFYAKKAIEWQEKQMID